MCYATAHHLAGFVTGAALATAAHQPAWVAVASAALASVTAGGVLSPDVDQFKVWRALDRWLPDEWLGEGGPLQHRGISHWFGWPLAAVLWAVYALPPSGYAWAVYALIAGWASHLLLDFAFGKRAWGRGPGIPLAPWWAHVGIGLDAGGMLEVWILRPVLVGIAAYLMYLVVIVR
jgi:membrane-bound metal-dependent hydrolase YbcI (DUF457 family)